VGDLVGVAVPVFAGKEITSKSHSNAAYYIRPYIRVCCFREAVLCSLKLQFAFRKENENKLRSGNSEQTNSCFFAEKKVPLDCHHHHHHHHLRRRRHHHHRRRRRRHHHHHHHRVVFLGLPETTVFISATSVFRQDLKYIGVYQCPTSFFVFGEAGR
jgi:hypothetical protein